MSETDNAMMRSLALRDVLADDLTSPGLPSWTAIAAGVRACARVGPEEERGQLLEFAELLDAFAELERDVGSSAEDER